MKRKESLKKAFALSVLSTIVCLSMLIGATFAWFTDSVVSENNKIIAGNVDVDVKHYTTDSSAATSIDGATDLFNVDYWEPGVIIYENFIVSNEGSLALKYDFTINVNDYNTTTYNGRVYSLLEVLKVAILNEGFTGSRTEAMALDYAYTLEDFYKSGNLNPSGQADSTDEYAVVIYWEPTSDDNIYNINNGRTTSDGKALFVDLGVNLVATQYTKEEDAFDDQYDKDAKTHDCEYTVQPSGLWKCSYCNSIIENTNQPYIMIYNSNISSMVAIPLLQVNASDLATVGLEIIVAEGKTTYQYVNSGTARTVYIRTNGNDLVLNAPNDTIKHYGKVDDVRILAVGDHSYDEDGIAKDIAVYGSGHVNISDNGYVNDLSVEKYADAKNVTLTFEGKNENVGTLAVYDKAVQKSITVVKDNVETTVEGLKNDGEEVVLIPENKAARVGTELFDTVQAAVNAAEAKGDVSAARVVNDITITEPLAIPADTVLKVSIFTKVEIVDNDGISIKEHGSLVNSGSIINTKDSEVNPVGVDIKENGTLVNYGGLFDSFISDIDEEILSQTEKEEIGDTGIFNKDGQVIQIEGNLCNLGNISNENGAAIDNKETGSVSNVGTITNTGELQNNGTVVNKGEIENNGSIVNDGNKAVLDLNAGSTTGNGDIKNENGAQFIEQGSGKVARIGSTYYTSLQEASDALTDGKTMYVTSDLTEVENWSIHGVKNVAVDLSEHTIMGQITLYDCNGVVIKNGEIQSQNIAFRIGEHQSTIVRWKEDLGAGYYSCSGYHPLAPAQNVEVKDMTISAKYAFSFTNINDDFTRNGQQQCYGKYLYKTGYTYPEQYVNGGYWSAEKLAEVFTSCTDIDSVVLNNAKLSYTGAFVENVEKVDGTNPEPGEGHSIDRVRKLGVLDITLVENVLADAGRFLADDYYLLGNEEGSFNSQTTEPTEFKGRVGKVYFNYDGGANDAITYSVYGETVEINENADAVKIMGIDDTLDILSTNGFKWTGAVAEKGYGIVEEVDGDNSNLTHYKTEIYVEASVWNGSTLIKKYGTLKEAFDNCPSDHTIKLERDVTITQKQGTLSGKSDYGVYFAGRRTFDLNGHTYTYTGTGAAICTSQKTGVTNFIDSVGGGKIIATKGYCIYKCYYQTEYYTIKGGTYISETKAPICLAGVQSMVIYGGTFIGKTGTFVGAWGAPSVTGYLRFEGGKFSNDISSLTSNSKITIVSGKSCVDNGDGTYSVK